LAFGFRSDGILLLLPTRRLPMSGSASPLLVQLPVSTAPSREQAAIICETIQEVWLALDQALLQVEHLPPARAWQVLLAPYGLQVVSPDRSAAAGSALSAADAGGVP
jgi:hypothetical protein